MELFFNVQTAEPNLVGKNLDSGSVHSSSRCDQPQPQVFLGGLFLSVSLSAGSAWFDMKQKPAEKTLLWSLQGAKSSVPPGVGVRIWSWKSQPSESARTESAALFRGIQRSSLF